MTENHEDISPLARKINDHLIHRVHNFELNLNDKISIVNTVGSFCNLQTFSDYARGQNITYNGVLERIKSGKVKVVEMFNVKFVADND